MKMLYIAAYDIKKDVGIYRKIQSQIQAFKKFGIETKLVNLKLDYNSFFSGRIINVSQKWNDIKVNQDIDALYIRYSKSSFAFINFLYKVRKKNPKIKILVEIPTYPYEKEETKKDILQTLKDRTFRCFMKKHVNRFITFSEDKYLFGVKTIKLVNGLNIADIRERSVNINDNNSINLVAVATMKKWHGYDRLLEGLGMYYRNNGKRKINVHMVGAGPEMAKYKSIVKAYNIENNVKFYGQKQGNEIDDIYDLCDIGVGSLGGHRIGLSRLSNIKSRDYAAKGLPIVLSGSLDIFPADKYNFIYEVPEDDTPVDIMKLVSWHDEIYGKSEVNKKVVAVNIRKLAFQKCDSAVALKPVCNYLL